MRKITTNLFLLVLLLFVACSGNKSSTKSKKELRKNLELTASSWDNLVSTTDLSDNIYTTRIPECGIRGRYEIASKYLSISIIENIVGEKAFVKGPHDQGMNYNSRLFGWYNPEFLNKLQKQLMSLYSNKKFVNTTQTLYNEQLKQYLRVYYLSYDTAANNQEIMNDYLSVATSIYIQDIFWLFAENLERQGYDIYEAVTCPGFWVRRSIDGTAEKFYDLLEMTLKTYDKEFIDSK